MHADVLAKPKVLVARAPGRQTSKVRAERIERAKLHRKYADKLVSSLESARHLVRRLREGRSLFGVFIWGLFLAMTAITAQGANQFVQITRPGWINSAQASTTGAWGDYDNDGFIDLFVANTAMDSTSSTSFLYHNNGNGTFTRKTAAQVGSIASDKGVSAGATWADVNNDGFLDLFVLNYMVSPTSSPVQCRLYINQGNGTFRSVDAGALTRTNYVNSWGGLADYDNDGFLDIFMCGAWTESGHQTNLLYHGEGNGLFSLVTNCVIATDRISSSFSNDAAWGDFDNDGKPDLIVGNFLSHNFLYHNEGHGRFTRLTNSVLENYATGLVAWGDYNNDGFLDLAGVDAFGVHLFRNDGSGGFLVVTNWPISSSYGPSWVDYDNDGYLDLLVTMNNVQQLFHNNRDGTFTGTQDAFTYTAANWNAAAWGDYDNDGFMDLFLAEGTGENALYRNLGNTNHWIKFHLQGVVANRSAIGAKVRVKATIFGKSFWQTRELSANNFSQGDLRPNFGLGDATNVDVVRIEWPSGTVQVLTNVAPRQLLTIWEPPALHAAVLADRSCLLTVSAQPNRPWQIESSPDLSHWQTLTTTTNANVKFQYDDQATSGALARFYRLVGP
jgi:hypothetical protein